MFRAPGELNIISIDPSMRSTGVVYCLKGKITSYFLKRKESRLELLGYYVKYFARIAKITEWDLLIIEEYPYGAHSQAVTKMAELGGVIRSCFAAHDIPILEVNISTWKSFIGIKLKKVSVQDKVAYQEACHDKFGFTFDTTDECDAFFLLWTVIQSSRGLYQKGLGDKLRSRLEELKIVL